ncbi:MAG: hypothetical protein ACTH93_09095 [Pseudoclavibacter sp.]
MSATDTGPAVKIDLPVIYSEVVAIKAIAAETSSAVKSHTDDLADHERRLRSLERSVISILAVGAILQVAIGAAITAIINQLIRL